MICLGLEGTAHTFGVAVMDDKKNILADLRDSYVNEKGGIIPHDAARHHREVADKLIKQALEIANITFDDIDIIAFSARPGLPPCLVAVRDKAKEIAVKHKKQIIAVNHCVAHLSSGLLFTDARNPVYIFVSGANTQIISLEGKRFRIFGETLDVGIGNALDKFGRNIGLGFPAGIKIEELAKKGRYTELPYTVKGMDLAFSGIVTYAVDKFKKGVSKEDLCYSIQETFFSMLAEVVERALAHTRKNECVVIGGVAANKRLSEMMNVMCKDRNARFYAIPLKYAGDNAVNICWQGILEYRKGRKDDVKSVDINPNERTDDVDVFWI